jgi:hypothetical protein
MVVRFFPGTVSEAPTLSMASAAAIINESQQTNVTQTSSSMLGAGATPMPPPPTAAVSSDLIPPAKKHTPVLKALPNSLGFQRYTAMPQAEPKVEIQLPKTQFTPNMEYLGYYVRDDEILGDGEITATEWGLGSAGNYQYVYIHVNGTPAKTYVIEKNIARLPDPNSSRKAQMIEVQGELQVLNKVNDKKNLYRALVTKTIQPVQVGARLTTGNMKVINPIQGSLSTVATSRIIGGQFERDRFMFGPHSLVFLDKGTSQGLQVGQTLSIYADERLRKNQSEALYNDRQVGILKVVHTTPNFSTGYVTSSLDDIISGDYVGQDNSQANAAKEQQKEAEPKSSDSGPDDGELEL